MQQSSPLAHQVEQAITELLSHVGYELILVEFLPTSRLLRLYIDFPYVPRAASTPAQDGAIEGTAPESVAVAAAQADADDRIITLEDCTKVSKLVSDVLDGEGIMDKGDGQDARSQYRLEVSSPGMDRPLVKPAHFGRFVGHPVRLSTRGRLAGFKERRFVAKLLAADDSGIAVHTEDGARQIPYTDLDKAQLEPTF